VPLFKIFLFLAPALFRVAARQRDLTMTGLLWLRAARRRSRIFEHALQKIAYRAAALISHENMRPLSTNGRRSNIRVFELVLLTPTRLLPSRAWLVWFPLQPFTSN
jgi:hypothetical protein